MNNYFTQINIRNGVKAFNDDCPHRTYYEAINRHVIIKLGSSFCRHCRFFEKITKVGDKFKIYCNHPEGIEIIPMQK